MSARALISILGGIVVIVAVAYVASTHHITLGRLFAAPAPCADGTDSCAHLECKNDACVAVSGDGTDQCQADGDCLTGTTPTPTDTPGATPTETPGPTSTETPPPGPTPTNCFPILHCETGDCDGDGFLNPSVGGNDCNDANACIGGDPSCAINSVPTPTLTPTPTSLLSTNCAVGDTDCDGFLPPDSPYCGTDCNNGDASIAPGTCPDLYHSFDAACGRTTAQGTPTPTPVTTSTPAPTTTPAPTNNPAVVACTVLSASQLHCETGDCDGDGLRNPAVGGNDCDDTFFNNAQCPCAASTTPTPTPVATSTPGPTPTPPLGVQACVALAASQLHCETGDCDGDGLLNPAVGGTDCNDSFFNNAQCPCAPGAVTPTPTPTPIATPPPSHLECRQNACVSVSGEGTSLCSVDASCVVDPAQGQLQALLVWFNSQGILVDPGFSTDELQTIKDGFGRFGRTSNVIRIHIFNAGEHPEIGASWDGSAINFNPGYVNDEVIFHELAHAKVSAGAFSLDTCTHYLNEFPSIYDGIKDPGFSTADPAHFCILEAESFVGSGYMNIQAFRDHVVSLGGDAIAFYNYAATAFPGIGGQTISMNTVNGFGLASILQRMMTSLYNTVSLVITPTPLPLTNDTVTAPGPAISILSPLDGAVEQTASILVSGQVLSNATTNSAVTQVNLQLNGFALPSATLTSVTCPADIAATQKCYTWQTTIPLMNGANTLSVTALDANSSSTNPATIIINSLATAPTPTPATSNLSCTPLHQTVKIRQSVVLTAHLGTGAYTWYATGATFATGAGVHFVTTYDTAGDKVITLNDSQLNSVQCTVHVNAISSITQVATGPGKALTAALLMSALLTLAYAGYTRTSVFRRREVETIIREEQDESGKHDPDFRL